jgi:hypothetical protein
MFFFVGLPADRCEKCEEEKKMVLAFCETTLLTLACPDIYNRFSKTMALARIGYCILMTRFKRAAFPNKQFTTEF